MYVHLGFPSALPPLYQLLSQKQLLSVCFPEREGSLRYHAEEAKYVALRVVCFLLC